MRMCFYAAPVANDFLLTEEGFGVAGTELPVITPNRAWVAHAPVKSGEENKYLHFTYAFAVSPKLVILLHSIPSCKEAQSADDFAFNSPFSIFDILRDEGWNPLPPFFGNLPRSDPEIIDSTQNHFTPTVAFLNSSALMTASILTQRRRDRTLRYEIHQLNGHQAEEINSLMLEISTGMITYTTPEKLLSSITFYERYTRLPGISSHFHRFDSLRNKLEVLVGPLPPDIHSEAEMYSVAATVWGALTTPAAESHPELEFVSSHQLGHPTGPWSDERGRASRLTVARSGIARVALKVGTGLLLVFLVVGIMQKLIERVLCDMNMHSGKLM